MNLEVDRVAWQRYCREFAYLSFGLLLPGVGAVGVWLALRLYRLCTGHDLIERQSAALRYWIDGEYLMVAEGLHFKSEKSIPLDRITDFKLVEGPLMRRHGIMGICVQTAGAGQVHPEAALLAVRDPVGVRNQLMKLRDGVSQSVPRP